VPTTDKTAIRTHQYDRLASRQAETGGVGLGLPRRIRGTRSQIVRAFDNVLRNAIEYSAHDSVIDITMREQFGRVTARTVPPCAFIARLTIVRAALTTSRHRFWSVFNMLMLTTSPTTSSAAISSEAFLDEASTRVICS
jgi:hypothetical protein